ncbi:MAG: hypothetical protein SAJ37_00355 [Oscillatoria sp. PMC 1068.18]|nr:hypothetical protein [Oscillatoria sp. PMC 1076.18]MEC4987172.1 hypothetical protein [Oscillatoria sp. PMC 1068.18]
MNTVNELGQVLNGVVILLTLAQSPSACGIGIAAAIAYFLLKLWKEKVSRA